LYCKSACEIVKLYDVEGNVLARRCSATHVWTTPENFNGDIARTSVCREANKVKTKNLRGGEAIERTAKELLDTARGETDAMAKLELFEQYDVEMEKAKELKNTPVTVENCEAFDNFLTIEEIAADLGVEVITTAPKAEVEEETAA